MAEKHDPRISLDFTIEFLMPFKPSRFTDDVWVRTIRRMVQLAEGKASQIASMNARYMDHNPTSNLPCSTTTITEQFSDVTVQQVLDNLNLVLRGIGQWLLRRFPHVALLAAFDEVDILTEARLTDRESNDLWEHAIGGKEGDTVHRYYITVLIFPTINVKLPIHLELYSGKPLDGTKSDIDQTPGIFEMVRRSLASIKHMPRQPTRYLIDRGFNGWRIWGALVQVYRETGMVAVSPAIKLHYGHEGVHEDPERTDLVRKAARRALLDGPMSPWYIHTHALDFAVAKIGREDNHRAGYFAHGDPGAPNLIKGMVLLVEALRKTPDSNDKDEVDVGDGWVGRITHITSDKPNLLELVEHARMYRKRNFIESTFWHYHWAFQEAGIHQMAGRVMTFGLANILLALHAVVRIWRGFYVTPQRFDYPLLQFLFDLYRTYDFPDEPP